jgi:pimeloyl-ACP methyl ester carboxylesterase
MLARYHWRGIHLLGALIFGMIAFGCSDDQFIADFDEDDRGALLAIHSVEIVSEARILSYGIPIEVRSAVDLKRIVYRTVDARGELTEASALLAVPVSITDAVTLVSYQHGTIVKKDGAPSIEGTENAEALVAVAFATDGYLAVMPDYLGLGLSPGLHPFVHAPSLGTAVVDALRAARHFTAREGIDLEDRIFLLGYSEGGYATAAAQQLIEREHADEFRLAGSAPMAAPWDLSGSMVDLFKSDDPYSSPHFLPYTLLAYNDVYGLEDDLSRVLTNPYDETLPPLFDGTHTGGEIDNNLPDVPSAILTQEFVEAFDAATPFPWRDRLVENDLLAWSPTTRTRIYHCVNDDLIPVQNAETAIASFRQRGVPESVVDLSTGDFGSHGACAPVFILLGKFWIDDIRSGSFAKDRPSVNELRRLDWRPVPMGR